MLISDWSSDVCSSDLRKPRFREISPTSRVPSAYRHESDRRSWPAGNDSHHISVRGATGFQRGHDRQAWQAEASEMPESSQPSCPALPLCSACAEQHSLQSDRKSTRLNSSHYCAVRMPCSARKNKQINQIFRNNKTPNVQLAF